MALGDKLFYCYLLQLNSIINHLLFHLWGLLLNLCDTVYNVFFPYLFVLGLWVCTSEEWRRRVAPERRDFSRRMSVSSRSITATSWTRHLASECNSASSCWAQLVRNYIWHDLNDCFKGTNIEGAYCIRSALLFGPLIACPSLVCPWVFYCEWFRQFIADQFKEYFIRCIFFLRAHILYLTF